jgi:hypothetical protein
MLDIQLSNYPRPHKDALTTTWKMKYRVINDNSRPVNLGIPSNRAKRRRTIGRSIMRIVSATGIPEMMPTTTSGSLHSQ